MEERVVIHCRGRDLCAVRRACGSAAHALVVMAHGGPGGDKRRPLGLFDALAEKLEKELGLSSRRFGFAGYGESDGTPLDMTIRSRSEELGWVVE